MLRHFEHVGMTTSNLDACIAFYVDLLGLRLVLRKATPNGGELAFLDAGGAMLEIAAPPGLIRTPAREIPNDEAGLRHLTFTVDSVDETFDHLIAAGVKAVERPREAFNREMLARVAFVRDPDGIIVELAQRPA
jgi:glyoxylase I family protein